MIRMLIFSRPRSGRGRICGGRLCRRDRPSRCPYFQQTGLRDLSGLPAHMVEVACLRPRRAKARGWRQREDLWGYIVTDILGEAVQPMGQTVGAAGVRHRRPLPVPL